MDVKKSYRGRSWKYMDSFVLIISIGRKQKPSDSFRYLSGEFAFVGGRRNADKMYSVYLDGHIWKPPVGWMTYGREIARSSDGSEQAVWQVGISALHLLGKKCKVCRAKFEVKHISIFGEGIRAVSSQKRLETVTWWKSRTT